MLIKHLHFWLLALAVLRFSIGSASAQDLEAECRKLAWKIKIEKSLEEGRLAVTFSHSFSKDYKAPVELSHYVDEVSQAEKQLSFTFRTAAGWQKHKYQAKLVARKHSGLPLFTKS